jgi:toxin ParE1/3/4
VASFKLTRAAEADLDAISRYTLREWNEKQARKYVKELFDCFRSVTGLPGMGKPWPKRGSQYYRIQQGKHWVYYKFTMEEGTVIVRILHQSVDQTKQVIAFSVDLL